MPESHGLDAHGIVQPVEDTPALYAGTLSARAVAPSRRTGWPFPLTIWFPMTCNPVMESAARAFRVGTRVSASRQAATTANHRVEESALECAAEVAVLIETPFPEAITLSALVARRFLTHHGPSAPVRQYLDPVQKYLSGRVLFQGGMAFLPGLSSQSAATRSGLEDTDACCSVEEEQLVELGSLRPREPGHRILDFGGVGTKVPIRQLGVQVWDAVHCTHIPPVDGTMMSL